MSKPHLASALVEELVALGLRFRVVLADSLYGESGESGAFTSALHRLGLPYVVALRSPHSVWLLPGPRVRQTRWRPFDRVFTDGSTAQRFIRATLCGTRTPLRSSQLTTDPVTLPPETPWDLMTNLPGTIEQTVGHMSNTFGVRTWIAYGCKHAKDDLGWADDRVTDYAAIARWWELVLSAYTLVSLQSPAFAALGHGAAAPETAAPETAAPAAAAPLLPAALDAHPAWDTGTGWKSHLNNRRLLLQPSVCACLLLPWLPLVPLPHAHSIQTGCTALASLVNAFRLALPT
jgi:hypothetical protein